MGGIDLTPSISVLTRGRGAHHVDQQVIRGFRNYLFVVFDAVILSLLLMLFLLLFRPGAEVRCPSGGSAEDTGILKM